MPSKEGEGYGVIYSWQWLEFSLLMTYGASKLHDGNLYVLYHGKHWERVLFFLLS